MLETAAPRKPRRRKDITVWQEHVIVSGAGGETLEVLVRLYPDAEPSVVVLEEIASNGGLSVVSRVREILLELTQLYPETLEDAIVALYQTRCTWSSRGRYLEWRLAEPISAGWKPVLRQTHERLSGDTRLPTA
jgi:hypothetical protein